MLAVLLVCLFLNGNSFVHFDQVVSELVATFVGQDVEVAFIIDHRFNGGDLELRVDIQLTVFFALTLHIDINTILSTCNHENFLIVFDILALVNPKEQWLLLERDHESMYDFELLLFVVVLQYFILLCEQDRVCLLADWIVFEHEVHADAGEQFVLVEFDWELLLVNIELISNTLAIRPLKHRSLENVELIRLLFVLDQVLSGNDSQVLLMRAYGDRNDLVPLSGLTGKRLDLQLSAFDLLEILHVVHLNLILICYWVQICYQEDVHGYDVQTEGTLIVGGRNLGLEIVFIFTSVNAEVLLPDLVGDAVFDRRPEHHLVTFHEVDHGVLKLGFIIFV